MVMTGEFVGIDGTPYMVKWTEKTYRLERVSAMAGVLRVPPRVHEEFRAVSGVENGLPRASIVIGEPGSGMSNFRDWLLHTPTTWSACTQLDEALEFIKPGPKPAAKPGPKLAPISSRQDLIIDRSDRGSEAKPDENEEKTIARLVAALEDPAWDKSRRVVLLTRNVANLRRNLLTSSILARGVAFRLPHFDPDELAKWVETLTAKVRLDERKNSKTFDALQLGNKAKRWIGGQPLLTHNFFVQAEEILHQDAKVSFSNAFDEAGAFLRDHRPHMVTYWIKQLEAIQKERPEARKLLRAYAAGSTKNPQSRSEDFPDADVDLFLAGWVGINDEKRWGIRSACHAEWVREVL
jgi:hypothetical protein